MKGAIRYILFGLLCLSLPLSAQETPRAASDLIYTYAGPLVSFQYSTITLRKWDDTEHTEKNITEMAPRGGAHFAIKAGSFRGDTGVLFHYGIQEESAMFFEIHTKGLYLWELSPTVQIGTGAGVYVETLSLSEDYNGAAGVELPFSLALVGNTDSMITTDLFMRYGFYGAGNNSRRIAGGLRVSYLFKAGRL